MCCLAFYSTSCASCKLQRIVAVSVSLSVKQKAAMMRLICVSLNTCKKSDMHIMIIIIQTQRALSATISVLLLSTYHAHFGCILLPSSKYHGPSDCHYKYMKAVTVIAELGCDYTSYINPLSPSSSPPASH